MSSPSHSGDIPLIHPVLLSGTVFINRSNNKSAVASMQTAGEDMKRKRVRLLTCMSDRCN